MTSSTPIMTPSPDLLQELAPTGRLRVALNFGNIVLAQRDPAGGDPKGIAVDLARALGRELQLPVDFIGFDAAGKVVEALSGNLWDLSFLAIDAAREQTMTFTSPYLMIEGTYLVKSVSAFRQAADLDRPGLRIAVGSGAAYELYLTRTLQHAQLIRKPTAAEAFQSFLDEDMDAVGGVRQVVTTFARRQGGLRVLDDSFMSIGQAMAIPIGKPRAVAFLNQLIEAKKADGTIAESLARSGQGGAKPAP